jgi:hypothetical protein
LTRVEPTPERCHLPCMTDKASDDLAGILGRLGPNMWLVLDAVALERIFGKTGLAAVQAAAHAAEQHDCLFIPDQEGHSGRFGRAYFEPDSDD